VGGKPRKVVGGHAGVCCADSCKESLELRLGPTRRDREVAPIGRFMTSFVEPRLRVDR